MMVTGVYAGDLFQLYSTQVLRLSASEVGSILGLLIVTLPIPLVASSFVDVVGPKRLLQAGYAIRLALLGALLAVPSLAAWDHSSGLLALSVVVVASHCVHGATFSVAWPPLIRSITTSEERGRFFGRIRTVINLIATVVLLSFTLAIGDDLRAWHYNALIGAVMAYLVSAIIHIELIYRQMGEPPRRPLSAALDWRDKAAAIRRVAGHLPLRRFLLLVVVARFAEVPLFAVYAKQGLHYGDNLVTGLAALKQAAVMATLLPWGHLVDRYGASRLIWLAMPGLGLLILPFVFVAPVVGGAVLPGLGQLMLIAAIVFATSALATGIQIAFDTEIHDRLTAENAIEGLAIYGVLTFGGAFLSQLVGGWAIDLLQGVRLVDRAALHIDGFKAFLGTCVIAALAVGVLMRRDGQARQPGRLAA